MMLIGVNEELLEDFETERKWRNHINNSTLETIHKEKQAMQVKLDIAVKALEDIGYCKSKIILNYPDRLVKWALEALAKIKGD